MDEMLIPMSILLVIIARSSAHFLVVSMCHHSLKLHMLKVINRCSQAIVSIAERLEIRDVSSPRVDTMEEVIM